MQVKKWLENRQFIFLLDGLDKFGLEVQNKCIEAINQFLLIYDPPGIIVCCRREEYERATVQLDEFKGAIYLENLENDQIYNYLNYLNCSSIRENLEKNQALLELARKPLFLNMLTIAYQGEAIKNFQELFSAYVKKQVYDPKNQGIYPPTKNPGPEKTLYYLIWLARQLEKINKTDFLIKEMQPTWLESTKKKHLYQIVIGLIEGLNAGLIGGLVLGLFFGLYMGVIGGLVFGLYMGVIGGLNYGLRKNINMTLHTFSLKIFLNHGLRIGLKLGVFFGLVVGLIGALIGELLVGLEGFLFGLKLGFAVLKLGVFLGLILALFQSEIEIKKNTNEAIYEFLKNYINSGIMSGM